MRIRGVIAVAAVATMAASVGQVGNLSLFGNLAVASDPAAPNLLKIDRTIRVEPTYTSKSPTYCLLVYGDRADTRVWLVRDQDAIFVDRNGNGDLTEEGERVPLTTDSWYSLGDVRSRTKTYTGLRIGLYDDGVRLRQGSGSSGQYVGFAKHPMPKFASRAAEAPVIHFDGPKTIGQYGTIQSLPPDGSGGSLRETWLRLMIGTPGVGPGTFAAYHCRCGLKSGTLAAEFQYTVAGKAAETVVAQASLDRRG